MALQVVCHDLRRTLPPLTPGEHQYRLAELNFISLIEGIDLILIHQLTIDFGAIRTSLIAQGIVAIALIDNRGMQTGNGQVFEEDITFAATSNAECLFTYLINTPWFFPLFNPHNTHTTLRTGANTTRYATRSKHRLITISTTEHSPCILSHSSRAKTALILSWLPGWHTSIASHCRGRRRRLSRLTPSLLGWYGLLRRSHIPGVCRLSR